MKRTEAVALCALLAAALLASEAQAERDRSMQGNGAFSKFKADVNERLTFNNDVQSILYRFDFNRSVPLGDLVCQGYQIVPKGQTEHLKKGAVTGSLLTQEQTYPLDTLKIKFGKYDVDQAFPGITNLVPQLQLYDFWSLKKPLVWSETANGIPFSQIYQQTQGDDVIFNMGMFNKGQVQEGNWVIDMCGTYSWDHMSIWEAEADLARRALGQMLLELSTGR